MPREYRGRQSLKADEKDTDLETVVTDLLNGRYHDPVRGVGFNAADGWSQDVSADVDRHDPERQDQMQFVFTRQV